MALSKYNVPLQHRFSELDPWERAKRRFLDGASAEQLHLFESATLEGIYYDACNAEKRHGQDSLLRKTQSKLNPLVNALEGFSPALTTYANASSSILCPLWGSIRVVLILSRATQKYFDELLSLLERVGYALPRFRLYQTIFPGDVRLMNLLTEAYLRIVGFCTDVKTQFNSKRTISATARALRRSWKDPLGFLLDKALQDISRIRDEIDRHAHAVHIERSEHFQDDQNAQSLLEKKKEEQELRRKALQKLAHFDCSRQHARLSSARRSGSSPQKLASFVSVFLAQGKTFLTSRVIDSFKRGELGTSPAICFHYCTHSDKRTLSLVSIFGSLTRQLVEGRDVPMSIFETIQHLFISEAGPDIQEAKDLFMSVLENLDSCVIVLDGLHELEEADLITMTSLLKEILQRRTIKLYLSALSGPNHLQNVFDGTLVLHLTEDVIAKDMQNYVAESVQSKIDSNELLFDDPKLRALIIETLQRGAKTMFLWVKLVLQELCEAQNDEDLRILLMELPKDLIAVFLRIARRVKISTGGEKKIALASKAFKWILGAYRPLRLEELREALAIEINDDHLHTSKIPFETRLIGCFGSFVLIDQVDRTVTFAHHTIQQFFLEESSVSTGLHLDFSNAQNHLAEACVTYLAFNDFETGVSKYRRPLDASLITRAVTSSSEIPQPIKWLCQTDSNTSTRKQTSGYDIHFGKFFEDSTMSSFNGKYQLLDYVVDFWCEHCRIFSSSRPEERVWTRFRTISCERRVLFPFRPWARDVLHDDPNDDGINIKLYQWALQSDHRPLVEILYQHVGCDRFKNYIEAASPDGVPLATAYFAGAFHIAKFFWQHHDLNPTKGSNDLEQLLIYKCAEKDSALVETCCKDIHAYRLVSKDRFSQLAIQILCTSSAWSAFSQAGIRVACNSARGVLDYDPECTSFEVSKAEWYQPGSEKRSAVIPATTRLALENGLRYVPGPKLVSDCIQWAIGCDDTNIARIAFDQLSQLKDARLHYRCIQWAAQRRDSQLVQDVLEYGQCEPDGKLLHGCIELAAEKDDVDLAKVVSQNLVSDRECLIDCIQNLGHPITMAIRAQATGILDTLLIDFECAGFFYSKITLTEDLCQGNALVLEVIAAYVISNPSLPIHRISSSEGSLENNVFGRIRTINACVQQSTIRMRVATFVYLAWYCFIDDVDLASIKVMTEGELVSIFDPQYQKFRPDKDFAAHNFTEAFLDWMASFNTMKLLERPYRDCLHRYSAILEFALGIAASAPTASALIDRHKLFQTALTHGNYVFLSQSIESGLNPAIEGLADLNAETYPELAFEMYAMLAHWEVRFVIEQPQGIRFSPLHKLSNLPVPSGAHQPSSVWLHLDELIPQLDMEYVSQHLKPSRTDVSRYKKEPTRFTVGASSLNSDEITDSFDVAGIVKAGEIVVKKEMDVSAQLCQVDLVGELMESVQHS
ncbi:MAG: hypothetical protein M1831_005367 [Alyxoria varia]|nr:MAG: hypothetical protein M1831_005367 [Alyxoria varia]